MVIGTTPGMQRAPEEDAGGTDAAGTAVGSPSSSCPVEIERPDRLVPLSPLPRGRGMRWSADEGVGGPEPLILRLKSWRPSRIAVITSSSSLGTTMASIKSGVDIEIAGVSQCPRGDPPHALVAVGKHLAKPELERTQRFGPLHIVAVDQARDRRLGLLGRGSSRTASIPSIAPFIGRLTTRPPATVIDVRSLGSSRPPSNVPAPSFGAILIRRIVLAVDLVRNSIAQTVFISVPCDAGPRSVALLGRLDKITSLGIPVDAADRLPIAQGPDSLDAVEHVIGCLTDDPACCRRRNSPPPRRYPG